MSGRKSMGEEVAWDLLRRAREVHVASVVDGKPLLRAMHAAIYDGQLWLHGSPRIGMASALDGPVQVLAEEVIARIPSWMRDEQRACPATTWYRSALVEGTLRPQHDPERRAAALQQLMGALQPEGRHVPLDAAHPLYQAAIRGLGVWSVEPSAISAVEKLGQDQPVAHLTAILRSLWERGDPGDLAAIEMASRAHPDRPQFWPLPGGLRARVHPDERDVAQAVALARGRYWNGGITDEALATAVRCSSWAGIERDGTLLATARAVSDRGKRSWIYDVCVSDEMQRGGVGTLLMSLLLAHPHVRRTEVSLSTRDAAGFYARLGFREVFTDRSGPFPRTLMRKPAPTAQLWSTASA